MSEPDEEVVVAAAVSAAEDVVFARFGRSEIEDLDITVAFDAGVLTVDVYLNVPGASEAARVADDAALAARAAVDALVEG